MTVPGEVTFKVKQFIAARERFTTGQVARLTGLNRKSVETVVQRLVRDGYVIKSRETAPGTGRGRRPLYYTLTTDIEKRKELVNEVSAFQPGAAPVRIRPLSANYIGAHEMLDELEREPDAPDREARLGKIEKHLELAAFEEGLEDREEGTAVVLAYLLRERARVAALRHQWFEAELLFGEAYRVFVEHGLEGEVEKTDQYRFTLLIRQRLTVAKDDEEIAQIWQEIPHIVQEMRLAANPVVQLAVEMCKVFRTFSSNGSDIEIRLWPGLFEILSTGATIGATVRKVGSVALVSPNFRITGAVAFLKSALDYTVAAVGLILLLPFLLLIALLVKLNSPGPALHRRRVLGVGGQTFGAFKFRTMRVDADEYLEQHPELAEELERNGKLKNDPRVTRLGKFLRKASIDELPQLINVLKGQMSLVGPRMIAPPEWVKFGKWKHNLLTVKPGITGLWQVSGRSELSYEDRLRLDMYYIRNYTIWLDMRILFKTIVAALSGNVDDLEALHARFAPLYEAKGEGEKAREEYEKSISLRARMGNSVAQRD